MPIQTVQLEPIATDWGEVVIIALVKTEHRKTTVEWEVEYPAMMPENEKQEMEQLISQFMARQHDDLVRLFGQ